MTLKNLCRKDFLTKTRFLKLLTKGSKNNYSTYCKAFPYSNFIHKENHIPYKCIQLKVFFVVQSYADFFHTKHSLSNNFRMYSYSLSTAVQSIHKRAHGSTGIIPQYTCDVQTLTEVMLYNHTRQHNIDLF